jgi:opacity protein-like surface antigen
MDTERVSAMKRLVSIGLALVLASSASLAQVVMPQREGAAEMRQSVFGLGFAFGPATGLGLSFRHHLPTTFSYQVNGGIIKVDDRMSYSVGAEFQADLSRNNAVRFFAAAGCSYFYTGKTSHNEMEGPGRLGVGLGGEFHAGSGVHATLEMLFTYFNDGTVLPLPQLGLHYYFR